ncbi:MAG: DUF4238 domain-containing protein [Candidatus Krumholzibacteriia bacterium]
MPRSYLASWCDPATPDREKPYVWIFPREGGDPKRRAPVNVFKERDIYTISSRDGERELVLEAGLSGLESGFAGVHRERLVPRLDMDTDDFGVVCAFTAVMLNRTVASRERFVGMFKPVLNQMKELQNWAKGATPEERRRLSLSTPRAGSEPGLSIHEVRR